MDPTAQNTPGKTANDIGTEPTHEETDFNSLQDYSPPTFTLDDIGFPECNWKGEPFDLSAERLAQEAEGRLVVATVGQSLGVLLPQVVVVRIVGRQSFEPLSANTGLLQRSALR